MLLRSLGLVGLFFLSASTSRSGELSRPLRGEWGPALASGAASGAGTGSGSRARADGASAVAHVAFSSRGSSRSVSSQHEGCGGTSAAPDSRCCRPRSRAGWPVDCPAR